MYESRSLRIQAIKALFFAYCSARFMEDYLAEARRRELFDELCEREEYQGRRVLLEAIWENVREVAVRYEEDFKPILEDASLADMESQQALGAKYHTMLMDRFSLEHEEAYELADDIYASFLVT